jgi:catechol 2,3-dioxygenase-like lactoylglutathione lyase family enzyme
MSPEVSGRIGKSLPSTTFLPTKIRLQKETSPVHPSPQQQIPRFPKSEAKPGVSTPGKLSAMASSQTLGSRLVPALLVRSVRASIDFYQRLGFTVTAVVPDEAAPRWAEVTRDGITLQFHDEPPHGTAATPIFSGTFYIFPEDVMSLAEEFRVKVDFAWGPEVMEYGMREFGIQDPDGYFLAFSEPAIE